MVLPLYLALTAAEFASCSQIPTHTAWMACHFSPYGTGLSNLPPALPSGSMVIVNDRTPIGGHDPAEILCQLKKVNPHLLLLDFQRPEVKAAQQLALYLVDGMDCPVVVSHHYARGLDCPVFLPPVPPDTAISEHIAPWRNRQLWLEVALEGITRTVTEKGCTVSPLPHPPEDGWEDAALHCHCTITEYKDHVDFHLYRTPEDLRNFLEDAKSHGITCAVGLYQELSGKVFPAVPVK